MVKYTCPTCKKEFNKKDSYVKHTEKRKNPCKPNISKLDIVSTQNHTKTAQITKFITDNNNNIQNKSCLYCDLVFTRKDTLKRHIDKFCKVKKLKDDENHQKLEEKDKLILELSKKIDDLTKKIDNVIIKIDAE